MLCVLKFLSQYLLQEKYMQVQDTYQLESPLYDSSAFIPANYNYFEFHIVSDYLLQVTQGSYIVPFQSHQITFSELLSQLLQKLGMKDKHPIDTIQLSLKSGYIVQKKLTAQQLRLRLCRQSASGITIQTKMMGELVNQAAVIYYINAEPDFDHSYINKWFLLLNNQEPFSISIKKNIQFNKLQKVICDSLNSQYKNKISPSDLSFYRIKKTDMQIALNWEKDNQLIGKQVTERIVIDTQELIGVEVRKENAKWPFSQVASEEYLIFHITNEEKMKLKFSMIANYQVGQLLRYLKIEHSNKLGIKIIDQIFPPCKFVRQASKYFHTGTGKFVKNVQCRLVSERQMFYYSMKKIEDVFEIEKDMVTKEKEGQFEKCRQMARKRSKQFEQQKRQYFTNYKQISPIMLYTSSVKVVDPNSTQSCLLYKSLNDHLRNQSFGLAETYKQEWRYKFSATLIKSLEKIKPSQKLTVYRGIAGHQLLGEVGQLYVAKQFVSTSQDKTKAQGFLKKQKIGSFLTIESMSGRSIKQLSVYTKEEQFLFMPYTYFRIVEKDTSTPIYKIKLEQIPAKNFESNPATIILWVDDKPKQGQKVITSLDCPMHTTFLHQLMSTKALGQWIAQNQQWITNQKIKKVVITNMKRKQNQVDVIDAGANAYKLVMQKIKNCEIVFYIGHVEGTKTALRKNEIDPTGLRIYNKRLQLREFIKEVCAPINGNEQEEVIQQVNKSVLRYFDPLQQTNKSSSSKSNK